MSCTDCLKVVNLVGKEQIVAEMLGIAVEFAQGIAED